VLAKPIIKHLADGLWLVQFLLEVFGMSISEHVASVLFNSEIFLDEHFLPDLDTIPFFNATSSCSQSSEQQACNEAKRSATATLQSMCFFRKVMMLLFW